MRSLQKKCHRSSAGIALHRQPNLLTCFNQRAQTVGRLVVTENAQASMENEYMDLKIHKGRGARHSVTNSAQQGGEDLQLNTDATVARLSNIRHDAD
jgi:hypothetical protein